MMRLRAAMLLATALCPSCVPEPATREVESTNRTGLPGYMGSEHCGTCHEAERGSWAGSHHSITVHEPSDRERENLGLSLLCGETEAKFVLGVRLARRFMVDSKTEPGMHVLLPCRYDVAPGTWTSLNESNWESLIWEKSCGACHTTGFSSDDFSFSEMRVGCEACHGPAGRHGSYESRGDMVAFGSLSAVEEVTICASCHLQGGTSRRTGFNYAYNYQPGDDLLADYDFDWRKLDTVSGETENPIDNHQKLLIRKLLMPDPESQPDGPTMLRCSSCHEAHLMAHDIHVDLERQEYCHFCHEPDDFSVKEYEQACNVCEF